jgi:murein DD-endopeptidase MepM/ murein hydrolase activator NlpD
MSPPMDALHYCQAKLVRLRQGVSIPQHGYGVLAIALSIAIGSIGMAEAAVHAQRAAGHKPDWAAFLPGPPPAPLTMTSRLVWEGADLDGDGQPDIANPTGKAPRGEDAYGEGRFHASRDGGEREHEGVDYVATAGQTVEAPISGYVSRIGFAYPDDQTLRYVEIENPALHLTARVFYIDPKVVVGDAVAVGHPIGAARTLQHRYPRGITDHVHLELAERGRKVDAQTLIVARNETLPLAAD